MKLFTNVNVVLVLVPTGSVGESFVKKLVHLYQAFTNRSSLECMGMYESSSLLHILLLQKPNKKGKIKATLSILKEDFDMQKAGETKVCWMKASVYKKDTQALCLIKYQH